MGAADYDASEIRKAVKVLEYREHLFTDKIDHSSPSECTCIVATALNKDISR